MDPIEDEESQSSGCVTETDDDDTSAASSVAGDATPDNASATNQSNASAGSELSGRVVVEKTELAPILEDEVLEIEPTPVAAVTTTPVVANATEDQQSCNVSASAINTNTDLPPVYEEEEVDDDGNAAATPLPPYHHNADTTSLMSPNDDAISITTSTDFHRQRSSFMGGTHPELLSRLLASGIGADDDDETPNLPYQGAPNGGYGWSITAISFFTFLIVEGVFYSFGVFFPHFIRHFNADESVVTWVGSVAGGSSYLFGPFASVLVDKFGLRAVSLGGCLLGAVALGFCVLAPNVYFLIFSWGLMFGISTTIATLPCHFALSLWFDTRRGLATGLGVAGGGLGSVLFPPFVSILIGHINWKAAMLFLCIVYFLMTMAVVFLKPVPAIKLPDSHMSLSDIVEQGDLRNVFHNPGRLRLQAFRKAAFSINSTATNSMWRLSQENITGGQTSINDIATIGRSQFSLENSHTHLGSSFLEKPEHQQKLSSYSNFMQHFLWNQNRKPSRGLALAPSEEVLGSQNHVNEASLGASKAENLNKPETPIPTASPGIGIPAVLINKGTDDQAELKKMVPPRRPLRRFDIFYSGSTLNLERAPRSIINLNSTWAFHEKSHELEKIVDLSSGKQSEGKNSKPESSAPQSTIELLAHMLNMKLMKQTSFLLFMLSYFIFMLGFFVPFVFLPTLVVDKVPGVTPQQASYFIPLIGLTNTVGRLVMGVVGDMGFMDPCYFNAVAFLACGLSTFLIPFFSSLTAYVVYALTFGFFCASSSCLRSLALLSLVGLENLTSGFGIVLFFQGIAALLGLPLASIIGNVLGSSGALFMASSVTFTLAGLIGLPLKPISVREIRNFQRREALSELEADEKKLEQQEQLNQPDSPTDIEDHSPLKKVSDSSGNVLEDLDCLIVPKRSQSSPEEASINCNGVTESHSLLGIVIPEEKVKAATQVSIADDLNEECGKEELEKSMS